MKKKTNGEEDIKPDLKHDTMEFSAATDGDDQLDTDDSSYEEEEINAEELEAIDDDEDLEAESLKAAETDREADPDNLPDENWTDDLPDQEDDEPDNEEHRNRV
jgi:hypothetical protein